MQAAAVTGSATSSLAVGIILRKASAYLQLTFSPPTPGELLRPEQSSYRRSRYLMSQSIARPFIRFTKQFVPQPHTVNRAIMTSSPPERQKVVEGIFGMLRRSSGSQLAVPYMESQPAQATIVPPSSISNDPRSHQQTSMGVLRWRPPRPSNPLRDLPALRPVAHSHKAQFDHVPSASQTHQEPQSQSRTRRHARSPRHRCHGCRRG